MTPDERDRFMVRLLSIWPTPTMSDATRVVWNEFLMSLAGPRSMKALDHLQKSSSRRPAQSDFWECYLAERGEARALAGPECFVCDDGWVSLPRNTVAPCPNGCLPPTREEREERRLVIDREWFADHEKRVAKVAALIEPAAKSVDVLEEG